MMISTDKRANTLLLLSALILAVSVSACDSQAQSSGSEPADRAASIERTARTIDWDQLIPPDYDPNKAIEAYVQELETLDDGDPRAMQIYGNIQAELDNAPVNAELDGRKVRLPGFIAPLENQNGVVSEFLLVPYFGACIHVPPPPVNQTVWVKAGEGQGINSEQAYLPIWIEGTMRASELKTDIGVAGYRMEQATISEYRFEDDPQASQY